MPTCHYIYLESVFVQSFIKPDLHVNLITRVVYIKLCSQLLLNVICPV